MDLTRAESVTDAHRGHYWRHGWVAVEGLFCTSEVARIRERVMQVAERERREHTAKSYLVDVATDGNFVSRKIDWPFLKDADLRQFVLDPRLSAAVSSLLGTTGYLVRDQVFLKPPRFGSAKPLHQDNAHMVCEPADQVIGAWIALDDADEGNGCLQYVEGSHRLPLLRHTEMAGAPHNLIADTNGVAELGKIVAGTVGAGGVLFHHVQTLHASAPNRSGRWRRGYSSHWVGPDVTSKSDALEWGYSATKGGRRVKWLAP